MLHSYTCFGDHSYLEMKSLFKLIVYIRKAWILFEFQDNQLLSTSAGQGNCPRGKTQGKFPFNGEAEVTQMARTCFLRKLKSFFKTNTRNQCWKLGRQRNCFQLIWTLQLQIYCLIWPPGYHACFLGKRFLSSCSWISRKKWPPRGDVYIAICFLKSSCL